ncbi:MAG TPA: hypothetical protein VF765_27830, partial [Polyangiaceae bacterium]
MALGVAATGCGGRVLPLETPCGDAPLQCIARSADACGAATAVDARCDVAKRAWVCPASSTPYVRTADAPAACLPFHDPSLGITTLGGSLSRIPLDDGRCMWIGESIVASTGQTVRNVGFIPDTTAPFATCPSRATLLGGSLTPAVTIEGGDDPSLLVQIDGGYRLDGTTHVLYRLFRYDATATFGVTNLGTGVGRWDPTTRRIVVGGPSSLRWSPDLNLGDASLVSGGDAYVLGCHPPYDFLSEPCALARLDASDTAQLFTGSGWTTSTSVSASATVTSSGPWISSLVPSPGALTHVYVVGFGSTLQRHVAPAPEGPWTDGPDLGACDLPSDDPHAFCAGPVVHPELADP